MLKSFSGGQKIVVGCLGVLAVCGGCTAVLLIAGYISPDTLGPGPVAVDQVDTGNNAVEEQSDNVLPEQTTVPATEVPSPKSFVIGDVIVVDDLEIIVYGWSTPPGEEYFEAEEGNMFVVIDLSIKNNKATSELISTLLQMTLKDSTGRAYDVDVFAPTESSLDGEYSPGELIRGETGFQIPAGSTGLIFVFDYDVWGSGKVFIELGDTPTQ